MQRIKTATGFFREVRPRAGMTTLALMFAMSFLGGAVGLVVAVVYCLPIPVTLLAFLSLEKGILPVVGAISMSGGGAAVGLLTASMVEDAREERRLRAQRAARHRPNRGPWATCVLREGRLHDSIRQAHELAVVPRRWR